MTTRVKNRYSGRITPDLLRASTRGWERTFEMHLRISLRVCRGMLSGTGLSIASMSDVGRRMTKHYFPTLSHSTCPVTLSCCATGEWPNCGALYNGTAASARATML
jgi:hypothetical protein